MEQMMEFMKGWTGVPLLISLKTGVVATILSFFEESMRQDGW